MMFLMILAAMRKIANKVVYIRGGKTIEYKPCMIIGTNIKFRPNPKQPPLMIPIVADAYINFTGLFAKRLFVVVEGSGQTSKFPDGIKGGAMQEDKVKKIITYPDGRTQESMVLERKIIQHVPAAGAQNPQLTVASSSISYFERGVTSLAASLPTTKSSLMMVVIYVLIGFVGGIAWGKILIK